MVPLTCAKKTIETEIKSLSESSEANMELGAKASRHRPLKRNGLPDFASISNVTKRKKAFFTFLRPIVRAENKKILKDRMRFVALYDSFNTGKAISKEDLAWLDRLRRAYHVKSSLSKGQTWAELLHRVDVVPTDLALTQSAIESQWGMSRFATEGNALFGKWCYTEDCGIVPERRAEGKTHFVEEFASAGDSVTSYMHNLNTHRAYKKFRATRLVMRENGEALDANELAGTLLKYSERGEDYVRDLKAMLRRNRDLMKEGA